MHKRYDILNQFHHVVWLGDLNYRNELEWDEACALMEQKDWVTMRKSEQLTKEMAAQRAFPGFSEGPLNFSPTYRWQRQTKELSNKRGQAPR